MVLIIIFVKVLEDSKTSSNMRRVSRVLFDMDGLLLDTENLYTEGTQQILDQFGHTYDWSFKSKLMGKRTDEVARMIVDNYQLPISPEEWIARSREKYDSLFPHVKSLPGVVKLVHHLARHKVPLAVASSSSTPAYRVKTQHHAGLFSMFDAIVLGDDPRVRSAKPAPDIFLAAAEQLRAEAEDGAGAVEDSLVVEDAPLGVAAGLAAGMPVLMVPHPRLEEAERAAATLVVENMNRFDPRQFGLPGYSYTEVDHVIFDMDGLLLSTQDMYSRVAQAMLAQYGKTPDYEFKLKVCPLSIQIKYLGSGYGYGRIGGIIIPVSPLGCRPRGPRGCADGGGALRAAGDARGLPRRLRGAGGGDLPQLRAAARRGEAPHPPPPPRRAHGRGHQQLQV